MPLINQEYLDAFSDNPYREEIDTRSDLEIELDNMIDPFASTVNFPKWTTAEDRIKEYTDSYGDVRYNINGVPEGTGSFPNMDSAQQYLIDNYWDPNEIDLPRVIQELKGQRAINSGGIPEYLQGSNPGNWGVPYDDFSPMDSSTWRIPPPEKDRYGNLQESVLYKSPDQSTYWMGDKDKGWRPENLLDYYAQQGNPELQRGSSTGFFPTKNYPEFATDQLQGMVDNNKLIEKYKSSNSGGRYWSHNDLLGVEESTPERNGYTYGSPGNKYRKGNGWLNEVLGHEAIHMDEDRPDYWNSIRGKVPYPHNAYSLNYNELDDYGRYVKVSNPYASSTQWQKAVLHPTMHYMDNQFNPDTRSFTGVDINRKGLENYFRMVSENPNNIPAIDQGFTGSPENRFGAQQEAHQWAIDVGDMKQPTPTNRGARPNMADVSGTSPVQTRPNHRFNRGGLVSLVL
jgi:hypothetical protein